MKYSMTVPFYFFLLMSFGSKSVALQKNDPETKKIIENKGQIVDQYGNTNTLVKYIIATENNNIAIRNNGFSYNVYTIEKKNTEPGKTAKKDTLYENMNYLFNRIDIHFLNCNSDCKIILEGKSNDFENYQNVLSKPEGVNKVFKYSKITYLNLYNNIDVEFMSGVSDEKQFEYNFVLHPGAKINDIKIKYSSGQKIEALTHKIICGLPYGKLTEIIPRSYILETKSTLNFNYKIIEQNTNYAIVGFDGKNKNIINETIVIDPTPLLDMGTYIGGPSYDNCQKIKVDSYGNFYVAGRTQSISNIATSGAYQTVYGGGGSDVLVSKFNAAGQRKWSTYYGGNDRDEGYALSISNSGEVFVSGITSSSLNIATPGAHQVNYAGLQDAFLAKFDSIGTRLWSTYIGGEKLDDSYDIALDTQGNVYVIGSTTSTMNIASPGADQPNRLGNSDNYAVKFNSAGTRQWGTYVGGNNDESASGIAYGNSNIYAYGLTNSTSGIATQGVYQSSMLGVVDAFIVSFNLNGQKQWGTYFGGPDDEAAYGLEIDATGNIYCSGYTASTINVASPGAYQTINNGFTDAFLAKFSNSGALQWSTFFGGESYDAAFALSINSTNEPVLAGYAKSFSNIATPAAYQGNYAGGLNDGLIAKFNASGMLSWASYFGTPSSDRVNGITTYSNGLIYICGITSDNTGLLCTPGCDQAMYGGGQYDGFIARFIDPTVNGINEKSENEKGLNVYPNPTTDAITIETDLNTNIKIYDVQGKLLIDQKSYGNEITINLSRLQKGIYLIQGTRNTFLLTAKIVKE